MCMDFRSMRSIYQYFQDFMYISHTYTTNNNNNNKKPKEKEYTVKK